MNFCKVVESRNGVVNFVKNFYRWYKFPENKFNGVQFPLISPLRVGKWCSNKLEY